MQIGMQSLYNAAIQFLDLLGLFIRKNMSLTMIKSLIHLIDLLIELTLKTGKLFIKQFING